MSAPRRSSAPFAAVVVAVLALAGCGGGGGDRASGDEGSRATWEATLGGQPVELEDAAAHCVPTESGIRLTIGDIDPDNPSRGTGILAVLALPEDGTDAAEDSDAGEGDPDGAGEPDGADREVGADEVDGDTDDGDTDDGEIDAGGPEVRIAHFALPDGTRLMYSPASSSGPGTPSTEATAEGDTYRIDGAGTVNDSSGGSRTAAFTLEVSCA